VSLETPEETPSQTAAEDPIADSIPSPADAKQRVRRRASRAAGPVSGDAAPPTMMTAVEAPSSVAAKVPAALGRPSRRRPNKFAVGLVATSSALALIGGLGWGVWQLNTQHHTATDGAARYQRYVDTAAQTVVNMFSYNQQTVDESVNRFVDGTSGPLRDTLSQNGNVDNLKAMFRDTNASSEARINGAAMEKVDETSKNASVLVAVRVTVTDIDGVNKPSQAYRLRVIVHEDDNGRMTGYDLKYPDGGN
jgi:Mce-associated membrane protein